MKWIDEFSLLDIEENNILEKIAIRRGKCCSEDDEGCLYSTYRININYICCLIVRKNTIDIVGFGVAKRNPKDRFNSNIGKKLAFTRAAEDYLNMLEVS